MRLTHPRICTRTPSGRVNLLPGSPHQGLDAPIRVIAARLRPPILTALGRTSPPPSPVKQAMSAGVAPSLAANMNAAFKKVRGAIGGSVDTALRDLIVDRIVELAKDGVYDIEELSSRTLHSLNPRGSPG